MSGKLDDRTDELFLRVYDIDPASHPEVRETTAWHLARLNVAGRDFAGAVASAVTATADDVAAARSRLRAFGRRIKP